MKPLQIGILGVSGHLMQRIMLPLSQTDQVEVVAIGSRQLSKASQAARDWGIPKACGSYEEVLALEEVEAVYIPLPNHLHLQWMMKAIDAGKHIICEKPLTLNTDELMSLMDYAEGRGVQIMEAFMYGFHPKWTAVKELIKVHDIGEVKAIHTVFAYSNSDPKNIRNIRDYGGGSLFDIGCYAISSARFIMGRSPNRVMALNQYSEDFGTDILSSAILDFGDARCMFTVSTAMHPVQEVKIYGTSGTIEVPIPFNMPYDTKGTIKVTTGLCERTIEFEPVNQYALMFNAFAKAIRTNEAVPISLRDSYETIQVIDQLFESSDSEQWEHVMPFEG